jgi:hypothetical protein
VSWIRKKVTPTVIVANRANSRKSTGPRTQMGKRRVGRNAGKYFVFGQISPSRMRELGEDPAEFEKLRQSLRAALGARDGFGEMLVEEMAVNRWRLGRLRRAETGILAVQQYGLVYQQRAMPAGTGASLDNIMIGYFGLTGVSDSPEKYLQILELLQALRAKVEKEGFTPQGLELLETVYGKSPGVTGMGLISKYKAQLESVKSAPQAENGEDAGSEPQAQDGEDAKPERDTEDSEERKAARASFLGSLNGETEVFAQRGTVLRLAQSMPVPESIKDAKLIPSREDLDGLMRYEVMLQREFERVLKELLDWRNRKREVSLP